MSADKTIKARDAGYSFQLPKTGEFDDLLLKTPDPCQILHDSMMEHLRSAAKKTDNLTDQEKFALCYAAGVPMIRHDVRNLEGQYKMTTAVQVGFFHNGEKWVVMQDKPTPGDRVKFREEV